MNVESVGHSGAQELFAAKQAQHRNNHKAGKAESAPAMEVEKKSELNSDVAAGITNKQRAHGVLRLLEEGHFKGVADVRLRINFHEELQARQAEQASIAVGETAEELLAFADEQAAFLPESGLDEPQVGDVQGLLTTFKTTVEGAQALLGEEQGQHGEIFLTTVEDGFNALISELEAMNVPRVEGEAMVEPAASSEQVGDVVANQIPDDIAAANVSPGTAEQVSPLASFLDTLRTDFSEKMTEARASLEQITALPELSEPSGKGAAYAKFVEIYNEIHGITGASAPVDTLVSEEGVDTTV